MQNNTMGLMMNRLICVFVFIFISGCHDSNIDPIQVDSNLKFGKYIVSPPIGYWYFQKEYPTGGVVGDSIFLVTFWKNKEEMDVKNLNNTSTFFNFALSENRYNSYDAYYAAANESGVSYDELKGEKVKLMARAGWSCKQTEQGVYGIECISLRDNLVTIGAYGNDKSEVLSNLPQLQKMLESFKMGN